MAGEDVGHGRRVCRACATASCILLWPNSLPVCDLSGIQPGSQVSRSLGIIPPPILFLLHVGGVFCSSAYAYECK